MSETGNQPIFENEAARASYFQAKIDEIKVAYEQGNRVHAEFMAKEAELHKRTEALIAAYPSESDNGEESAIIPFYTYQSEDSENSNPITLAVRILQKKRLGTKGEDTKYYKNTIEFLQLEDGRLPRHLLYFHSFDHKVYGHFARPGVGTQASIERANGYTIQTTYEARLSEIEGMLVDSTDEASI